MGGNEFSIFIKVESKFVGMEVIRNKLSYVKNFQKIQELVI